MRLDQSADQLCIASNTVMLILSQASNAQNALERAHLQCTAIDSNQVPLKAVWLTAIGKGNVLYVRLAEACRR